MTEDRFLKGSEHKRKMLFVKKVQEPGNESSKVKRFKWKGLLVAA